MQPVDIPLTGDEIEAVLKPYASRPSYTYLETAAAYRHEVVLFIDHYQSVLPAWVNEMLSALFRRGAEKLLERATTMTTLAEQAKERAQQKPEDDRNPQQDP
jgi:hypothetical protein